ncbi:fungal-specific transcription factor domain-containing protein, partial [Dipodascopsis uninucleata]
MEGFRGSFERSSIEQELDDEDDISVADRDDKLGQEPQTEDRKTNSNSGVSTHNTERASSTISIDESLNDQNSNNTTIPSIQKRRRVTRACDECRRKKIKCDGKQPCTHCTVYSYECTYNQPSNRRKNPTLIHVNELESQLQRANAVISTLLPGVDIFQYGSDMSQFISNLKSICPDAIREITRATQQILKEKPDVSFDNGYNIPETSISATNSSSNIISTPIAPPIPVPQSSKSATPSSEDTNIESMVISLGRLDVDETGHLDYVGRSSGRSFAQIVRAHFLNNHPDEIPADLAMNAQLLHSLPNPNTPSPAGYTDDSPSDRIYQSNSAVFKIVLPPHDVAKYLVDAVFAQYMTVLLFDHRPSIVARVDALYAVDPDDYGPRELGFLPLFYMLLAVGGLMLQDMREMNKYKKEANDSYKYFVAARKMVDITEARDVEAVETILLMVLYLQSTARLSTCYSYIGLAERAALRLGMHRKVSYNFNPIEQETRKRVFWTIWKLDIHISAMLGLPRCLSEDDIDQEFLLEVDDEYITANGVLPHPAGLSLAFASNMHTKLMMIVSRIVEQVYPIKASGSEENDGAKYVSFAKIMELENELQLWADSLPLELRPGLEPPAKWIQLNRTLNIALCYAKIILYRPFIHYISQKYRGQLSDERPYACAANCISTSRVVIHVADDLFRRDLLRSSHLFAIYTIFFATAVLLYYIYENPYSPHIHEFIRDVELGKDIMNNLKTRGAASARIYIIINGLFDLLKKRLSSVSK